MCVYIAMIAFIVAVMLWCVDVAAAFKCNGYRLESLLVGHLEKGSVHWRGSSVCDCTGQCTQGGGQNFLVYH